MRKSWRISKGANLPSPFEEVTANVRRMRIFGRGKRQSIEDKGFRRVLVHKR